MFNPVASGIRPKIVVIAVNKTGFSLASPAFTTRTSAVSLSKNILKTDTAVISAISLVNFVNNDH